ncbi:hypothetical protein [Kineococcus sp. SYSU DK003]|uniref:hypothetical protein n=1 Tax=Kineococcus sp. SYSU DK003 TaxID=3383124 RepID=UPI003D7CEC60
MTFTEALSAAMDVTDGREYISRVKRVVRERLEDLDQTAVVEDTHYFNHSAIPDFSLSWPGESGQRSVFLRDSYDSIAAGNDERYLASLEPVLLSLDATPSAISDAPVLDDPSLSSQVNERRESSPQTLVTDVAAVDVLVEESSDASPLGALVRSNFVRGARGHIDKARASELVNTGSPDLVTDRSSLIRDSFSADAALRITRTARLIDRALGQEGSVGDLAGEPISGRLSLAELRSLLPWLLSQPRAVENRGFWRELGGLMDFSDLERMRNDLGALDVTPLIRANSDVWLAKWAYLGLAVPTTEQIERAQPLWSFAGGRLGVDIGDERLHLASNGTGLGSRPSSSAARWEDVAGQLESFRLSGVTLQGIRRSVAIEAGQTDDIRRDVDEVTTSLDDQYHLTRVRVSIPPATDGHEAAEIEVDFGGQVAKSTGGASIQSIFSVVGKILKFRDPIPEELIRRLTS